MENNRQNNTNSQTNENNQPRRRKKGKKGFTPIGVFTYIIFIFAVSAVISVVGLVLANDMFAFMKEDKVITVDIAENATISDVADELGEKGVIEHAFFFSLFTTLTTDNPEELNFTVGTHELNYKMDYRAIMSELVNTSNDIKKITIPEGYTIDQIVELLVKEGISTQEKLMKVINEYPFKHEFLKDVPMQEKRLEGYLFPDTYEFYVMEVDNPSWDENGDGIDDAAVQVINKMLNNFDNQYTVQISDKADDLGLTMQEVITIASMIEREAKLVDEQPTISGVIHNRLNSSNFQYLQIDATLQYAYGHNNPLTREELDSDHPYNTYTNKGLPPGPIASPGFDAIYSAVTPDNHSYYYYVAREDGSHIFSETLDQHNAAVASVQ